jgi:DNA-binding IclR family transcriptional regulator
MDSRPTNDVARPKAPQIFMAVLKEDHLVFVDQVPGSQRLRAVSAIGEVFPLHSTANGKACLALMGEEAVRRLLPSRLPPLADGRRRRLADLLAELAEVRRTGVAFDEEDHSFGISAVGVAFRDPAGSLYAISIPVPTARFRVGRETLAAQLLVTRARLVVALR